MSMATKSKKWLLSGAVAVVVLSAPLYSGVVSHLGKTSPVYAAGSDVSADKHVISVNGEGEMTVQPDVAYVTLGVQSKGQTANEAQKANSDAFDKLENVLYNDFKLEKKDVKTSNFSVYPDYSYADKEQKITGYTATQTVQITYRDLPNLGTLLDAASAAGVNLVNGIQFSTEKSKDYELQVIQKAMANAEDKAKVIAKYAGKDLQGIINVTQNGAAGGPPVIYSNVQMGAAKSMAAADSAGTSISAGELKISTTVTVQYAF